MSIRQTIDLIRAFLAVAVLGVGGLAAGIFLTINPVIQREPGHPQFADRFLGMGLIAVGLIVLGGFGWLMFGIKPPPESGADEKP